MQPMRKARKPVFFIRHTDPAHARRHPVH
jgi:hypothetical protein